MLLSRRFWNKCLTTAASLVFVILCAKLIKNHGSHEHDVPVIHHHDVSPLEAADTSTVPLVSDYKAVRKEDVEAQVSETVEQSGAIPLESEIDYLQGVLNMSIKPTNYDTSDLCPFPPPGLVGPMIPNLTIPTDEELLVRYENVHKGGYWKPPNCTARWRIAILVPFRYRDKQLRVFLNVFHELLQKQLIEYRIFILEHSGDNIFNRAMLFNVGFKEVLDLIVPNFDFQDMTSAIDYLLYKKTGNESFSKGKRHREKAENWLLKASEPFDCYFFHDVDMLPLDDRNIYSCTRDPRHVGHDVPKWSWLEECLYGAFSMTLEQFLSVNGLSNKFAGWGGEDNDLFFRLTQFWPIQTYPSEIGAYKMFEEVEHVSEKASPSNERLKYIDTWHERWTQDGLNSLETNCPHEVTVIVEPLLTRISINLLSERC